MLDIGVVSRAQEEFGHATLLYSGQLGTALFLQLKTGVALRRQETGFGQGLGPGEREAVPDGDLARGQPRQTEFALLGHTGGNGAWLVARTRPRQRSLALGGVARRGERTDQVLLM